MMQRFTKKTIGLIAAITLALAHTAATATEGAPSTSGGVSSNIGRIIGMMIFGFVVMRFFRRKDDDGDDEEKSGFFGRVKPIYVVSVVILGLALLMWRSG